MGSWLIWLVPPNKDIDKRPDKQLPEQQQFYARKRSKQEAKRQDSEQRKDQVLDLTCMLRGYTFFFNGIFWLFCIQKCILFLSISKI